jgi:hypothetical protein
VLAERESSEDAVTVSGVEAALTVTTPANSTVIRRTATETGTILYTRMGCLGKTFLYVRRIGGHKNASVMRNRKNDAARSKRPKNGYERTI